MKTQKVKVCTFIRIYNEFQFPLLILFHRNCFTVDSESNLGFLLRKMAFAPLRETVSTARERQGHTEGLIWNRLK